MKKLGFLFAFCVSYSISFGQIIELRNPDLNTVKLVNYSPEIPPNNPGQIINKLNNLSELSNWDLISIIKDNIQQTHTRFQQHFKDIPVFQGVAIIHGNENGIFRINGDIIPENKLIGSQIISEEEALQGILNSLDSIRGFYWLNPRINKILQEITNNPDTSYYPYGSLCYVGKDFNLSGNHQLCWKFRVLAEQPLFGKEYFIHAETGEIWAQQDIIHHTEVTGSAQTAYSGTRNIQTDSIATDTFVLREYNRGQGIYTFNMQTGTTYANAVDFVDDDNDWNNVNAQKDEVATDAHWGAEETYDYFLSEHNRNSFDDKGAKIYSFVHYSKDYDNAFWNGSFMTYGDGNTFKPLTALDVCGHEIAHAVTTNTANLIYKNESGALNESFSDVFGQSVEARSRPTQWQWKMGEDITSSGLGLRDMSNPNPYNDPQYYKGIKWYSGTGDNGGVHINSGVQNYWYYLLVEGVSGTNEVGDNYNIDSLGFSKAGKIAYRNLSVYLTPSSTYADARTYGILSAADLYGQCSPEVIAVTNAWWVCGVGNKYDSSSVIADFLADTLVCKTTDTIHFTNRSENFISSSWSFGDGNSSSITNPKHIYSNYGDYTITLTVESCFNQTYDTLEKSFYVHVDSSRDICSAVILPFEGTDTAYQCMGFVYDDGGEGDYGGLKTVIQTIDVPFADSVTFRFLDLDYEDGYDSLYVYLNSENPTNLWRGLTGSNIPNAGDWITLPCSALVFKQFSDPYVVGRGFKVEYYFHRKAPTVDLTLADTVSLCFGDSLNIYPSYQNIYPPEIYFGFPSGFDSSSNYCKTRIDSQLVFMINDACMHQKSYDTVYIDVLNPINTSLSPDTTICFDTDAKIKASVSGGLSNYSYLWNISALDTNIISQSFADTSLVTVIVSDGCSIPDTVSMNVSVLDSLEVDLSQNNNQACLGELITINAISKGGKPNQYSFIWNPNKGNTNSIQHNLDSSQWIHAELTDGCSSNTAKDSIYISIPDNIKTTKPNDTFICFGNSINIDLQTEGGKINNRIITWNDPLLNLDSFELTKSPGTYYLKYTVNDNCVNPDSGSFVIEFLDSISFQLNYGNTDLCMMDSFYYTVTHSGGVDSLRNLFINGSLAVDSATIDIPNTTTLLFTVSDGCSLDKNQNVYLRKSTKDLVIDILRFDSTMCWYDTTGRLDFSTNHKLQDLKISWNNISVVDSSFQGLGPGTYTLFIEDSIGCNAADTFRITRFTETMKGFRDTTIHRGTTAHLYVVNTTSQDWFGEPIIGDNTATEIWVNPIQDTLYWVEAIDINGCFNEDTFLVQVIIPPNYKLPNIISPDNDGNNDFWDISPLGDNGNWILTVSDRQGNRVFHSDNYQNNWNGTDLAGNPLYNGVYFYHLRNKLKGNIFKGYIQIIH